MITILLLLKARNAWEKRGRCFMKSTKIFLYKEDFEKFSEGLKDAVNYINNENGGPHIAALPIEKNIIKEKEPINTEEFTNIEFDDLGKK